MSGGQDIMNARAELARCKDHVTPAGVAAVYRSGPKGLTVHSISCHWGVTERPMMGS